MQFNFTQASLVPHVDFTTLQILAPILKLNCFGYIQYYSTDPNIKNTLLCKADPSCLKENGRDSSAIYFNIKSEKTTVQKIENCNGYLACDNDRQCSGQDIETIKKIAGSKGKSGIIKI